MALLGYGFYAMNAALNQIATEACFDEQSVDLAKRAAFYRRQL
jgi:hypothetical protein